MPAEEAGAGGRDELDSLSEELRDIVRRRHESGEYPPGLEADLDEHFRRIVGRSSAAVDLEAQLVRLDAAADIGRHRIPTDSRLPAGGAVHAAVARLVARQTDGILAQLRDVAVAVRDVVRLIADRLPDDDLRDVSARVDVILERLASYERGLPDPGSDGAAHREALRAQLGETVAGGEVLELEPGIGLAPLRACADESLDAVLLLGDVQELSHAGLRALGGAAFGKLKQGGRLVLRSSGEGWASPAPEAVEGVLRVAGFEAVTIATGDAPPQPASDLERRIQALERRFAPFVLVATR